VQRGPGSPPARTQCGSTRLVVARWSPACWSTATGMVTCHLALIRLICSAQHRSVKQSEDEAVRSIAEGDRTASAARLASPIRGANQTKSRCARAVLAVRRQFVDRRAPVSVRCGHGGHCHVRGPYWFVVPLGGSLQHRRVATVTGPLGRCGAIEVGRGGHAPSGRCPGASRCRNGPERLDERSPGRSGARRMPRSESRCDGRRLEEFPWSRVGRGG
jgi:hypothetical protein